MKPMAEEPPVSIVNVGYRSTNYWVISAGRSRLLVDIGWPGTMGKMRAVLERIGIAGEIFPTPGHSLDNGSLLLDNGSVFTGDLQPEESCLDNPVALASWRLLREEGATTVYPAHGPVRPVDAEVSP